MTSQKCPFYGFRWPDRKADLIDVGGNECGLDLDNNGACTMESQGCAADFSRCEAAASIKIFLWFGSGSSRIRFFPSGSAVGIAFEDWTNQVMRRSR